MTGKRPPGPGRGRRVKQGSGVPAGGQIYGAGTGGKARGKARLIPGGRTRASIASKAERAEALIENLETLAFGAEHEMTRVAASKAALERLVPDANAKLEAETRGRISRVPMTEEEWEAKHGAAADLGAAGGASGSTH